MEVQTISINNQSFIPFVPYLLEKSNELTSKVMALKEIQLKQIQLLRNWGIHSIKVSSKEMLSQVNDYVSSSKLYVTGNINSIVNEASKNLKEIESLKVNLITVFLVNLTKMQQVFGNPVNSALSFLEKALNIPQSETIDSSPKNRFGKVLQSLKLLANLQKDKSLKNLKKFISILKSVDISTLASDIQILSILIFFRLQNKVYEPTVNYMRIQITESKLLLNNYRISLKAFVVNNYTKLSIENLKNSVSSIKNPEIYKKAGNYLLEKKTLVIENLTTAQLVQLIANIKENSVATSKAVVFGGKAKGVSVYLSALQKIKDAKTAVQEEAKSLLIEFEKAKVQKLENSSIQYQEYEGENEPLIQKPIDEEEISRKDSQETEENV